MTVLQYRAVVIGASACGSKALLPILQALPANFAVPIVIVQHLHPSQRDAAAMYRADALALPLCEAEEKQTPQAGCVYFAPANYHLLLEHDFTFSLSIDARVHYSRPSIDVLFESAAQACGAKLIGILLSGANQDGAAGLRYIQRCGGVTLVQDPNSAEVSAMPRAALAAFQPDAVLTPAQIARWLLQNIPLEILP